MAAADQAGDVVVVDGRLGDGAADHLLHRVLIRLPGTADAARTSVLSRRWRRVWLHLPELALRYSDKQASPSPRVDAALAACSAPVLDRLEIDVAWTDPDHVTSEHISSWLRFASRRLAGELRLSLPCRSRAVKRDVVLPLCERLTAISLTSLGHALRFQAAPLPGAFAALAALTIGDARVDGRELEDILSSRCPRLKELALEDIFVEDRDHPVLSIRSGSLERLRVRTTLDGDCLQVSTPELRALHVPCIFGDAHIVTPKLSEVRWGKHFYDPSRHQLVEAGRHLRRLEMAVNSHAVRLMGRFDTADELTLNISILKGADEYERFLEGTKEATKCKVLVVRFGLTVHAFEPIIHHLLRKCGGIRKLVVQLGYYMDEYPCELPSCPCYLLKNRDPLYALALDSLQEVEVEEGGEESHKMELLSLLYGCSHICQKKVSITIPVDERNWRMRRKIDRLLIDPSDRVQLTVRYTSCRLM